VHEFPTTFFNCLVNCKPATVQQRERVIMDLIRAADVGAYDEVVHLIEDNKADVNYQNDTGNSALHVAASRGHEKIVCYLVEHGADLTLENKEQKTPMQLAAPRLRGVMKGIVIPFHFILMSTFFTVFSFLLNTVLTCCCVVFTISNQRDSGALQEAGNQ
jgi:hypothetical protein